MSDKDVNAGGEFKPGKVLYDQNKITQEIDLEDQEFGDKKAFVRPAMREALTQHFGGGEVASQKALQLMNSWAEEGMTLMEQVKKAKELVGNFQY